MQHTPNKAADGEDETLLFRSNGVSPLRVLTLVSFAFALGSALLATLLLDRNVHMGHSISFGERGIWASGLVLTFSGFFLAVWMYERRVAARLVLLNSGRAIRLTTPTLFGMREHDIPLEDVVNTEYHEGDRSGADATSPPWLYVKCRHQPSFVVSLNGVIPNRAQLLQVLSSPQRH
ncbi:MAG: hypothetical protein EOO40_00635 [Deltaproteobacteria bacterium]|nr:MAG: hypothetical protein EOO40_00635 [Deltaproteobacteria bacterium]